MQMPKKAIKNLDTQQLEGTWSRVVTVAYVK